MVVIGAETDSSALILPNYGKEPIYNSIVMAADLILGKHIHGDEIDTPHLKAKAVSFDKLISSMENLCQNPGFETGDVGWDKSDGAYIDQGGAHWGNWSLKVEVGTVARDNFNSPYMECAPDDIFYASTWCGSFSTPIANANGKVGIYWYDKNKASISVDVQEQAPAASWAEITLKAKAPANSQYCRFLVATGANASPAGDWRFDDCHFNKASQIIVQGDPAGARVEITPEGFRAYKNATEKTVDIQSATGDAWFGGDVEAKTLKATEIATDSGYVETALLIDQDIVDNDSAFADYNIDKGKLYTITGHGANMTDRNQDWTLGLTGYDSNNDEVVRSRTPCGNDQNYVYSPITFFSGKITGGTTPKVTLWIFNNTGGTRHFHGWLRVARAL